MRAALAYWLVALATRLYPPLIPEMVGMTIRAMANLPLDNAASDINLEPSRRDQ